MPKYYHYNLGIDLGIAAIGRALVLTDDAAPPPRLLILACAHLQLQKVQHAGVKNGLNASISVAGVSVLPNSSSFFSSTGYCPKIARNWQASGTSPPIFCVRKAHRMICTDRPYPRKIFIK